MQYRSQATTVIREDIAIRVGELNYQVQQNKEKRVHAEPLW